jgi:CDP-glucose 4,6-dehydratase
MNKGFTQSFKGRSVFVTGHTGFKGSWLCLWLHRLGAKVSGYSLEPPTNPNNFTVSGIESLLSRHYEADVRDERALHSALSEAAPDVVLHLAAQSVVSTGYESPRETFETNVIGIASLLDGVAKLERDCAVVVVTSDKCYENREQVWGYRENDPFGDYDPYGASKGAAEILVRSYRKSFFPPGQIAEHGVRLASARAGNVIGGGDWTANALLVDMFNAFSSGRELEVRAPNACRPWQHVLQALSGYLTLAARLSEPKPERFCDGWNIGPVAGSEISVREIVEFFIDAWGGGSWRDASDPNQRREAEILRLSIDKAIWQLGWQPMWGVEETFRRAAEWYQAYQNGSVPMQQLGLDQIAAYEDALHEFWDRQ